MNVIFFGASELGFNCCQSLIESNIEIKAIFSIPQKFTVKYKNEDEERQVVNYLFKDFSFFSEKYNIPVYFIERNIKRYAEYIKALCPDLIIVVGWYYSINEAILKIPQKGCCAIHASLLPKYRGNAPLVWAMINGEKQTGVSLFYIGNGIDDGDIIAQKAFDINPEDTIKEVLKKAEDASIGLLKKNIPKVLNGTAERFKQNKEHATYFPKRTPEDGEIDWSWDSERINRFIKAQTHPYPGAFTKIGDKKILIWSATVSEKND